LRLPSPGAGALTLRIVVRDIDARGAREAQASLAGAGIEATALAGPYRSAPDGEDVAIFPPLAGDAAAAEDLARACAAAERAPLVRLVGLPAAAPAPMGLAAQEGFTGALALDAPPKLLAAQMHAWLRVAAADDERQRRAATAADIGAPSPQPVDARKLRALYVGAPSSMFLALERALADH